MTKLSKALPPSLYETFSWILAAFTLFFVLKFHLLPALLAGLLVYELVHIITPYIARRFPSKKPSNRSKLWAVGILVAIIVSLLALAGAGLVAFLRSDAGSVTVLLAKMAQILEDSRKILPNWLLERLPADAHTFKEQATDWLRTHADELQVVGKEAGRVTAHVLIGMVIGGMLAIRDAVTMDHFKPFARALAERGDLFGDAFKRVVFAQLRISAINTAVTGLYLAVILPLMGIHLPLVKTMIAITFVVGLIPVIGNLISNTMIVVVSLSHSLGVAIASLLYLVVIHKFEYFLNARIVGGQIRANAWELLIAMLVMESAFGLAGIVAAPIYYAYIKAELRARDLV
ncbi:MAG: AI-2E family transporter [Methylotenera sp.]|uniref:AI-2E family transporter n=1 Tax=Methylotenera sp. TaxID=2051956 RepID=UPI00272081D0|nr:AI-2E family transporter [Methylotenera sp.]MDO9393708.1 AI-2E family transporter [Methylotenera sp.]MDP1522661.1 AI-2E family transporter [Methylotenera sp.]MDP2230757.1 AI-2E family transporter [Methylotenera sp.]MDP3309288.1 AI-2E family transporter [Methylotenera sp.]MDP3818384.1 AI-2E family transporter [Methylotenera sp.]